MNFALLPMMECELPMFKRDIQEAFQKGFEDVYGKTEETILPEKDIEHSLEANGSITYKAIIDGEIVGGAVVVINEKNPDPNTSDDFIGDGGDGMFEFEKVM